MTLTAGAKIGPYEILSPLGAGGMGEVYRARDTRLNRDVAIKILPDLFATDPDRLARFKREAQVLASLNHPNIAAIYGLEEQAAVQALVLELVEGPTLADRIAHGAIPIDEALPIARQIAEALEAAHEHGVVHRDLKPANIKLRPDGTVKVLDFGLAKALEQGSGIRDRGSVDATQSPTITSPAATRIGMIMGTAAYMSPEQARGKAVDKRSDIWAFGCVLYEMLTGKRTFGGDDVTDTIAAIVRAEPEWVALPASTPPAIRRLLRRSLAKDRRERLSDIADARLEINEALTVPAEGAAPAGPVAAPLKRPLGSVRFAWAIAAISTAAAIALGSVGYLRRAPAETRAYRSSIVPPQGSFVVSATSTTDGGRLAVSPDGRHLAFIATGVDGRSLLWMRRLDGLAPQPVTGTDGASSPFWSPDSRFLAFFADGKLKKVDIVGGPPLILCDTPSAALGGTWNGDDVILFALTGAPIQRVAASGGTRDSVTALDGQAGETGHWAPFFLPDGRHFLYFAVKGASGGTDAQAVYIGSLDSGERKLLFEGGSNTQYASGHVLFVQATALMAQPFDANRLELTGDAVLLAEQVYMGGAGRRRGDFSVSETGVLLIQTYAGNIRSPLVWFDRAGTRLGTLGDEAEYVDVELSPDGAQAAVSILDPARRTADIWIYDVARNLRTRLTSDPSDDAQPLWSPDSARIAFMSRRKGFLDLMQTTPSGRDTETTLFEDQSNKFPTTWSPDGQFIVYGRNSARGRPPGSDVWRLPLFGEPKPLPVLETSFNEGFPKLSPNGRWLAYQSSESGRSEVHVAPFPRADRKWVISSAGGSFPRWRRDGREIFYVAPDNKLMAVAVNSVGTAFEVGAVRPLFDRRPTSTRITSYAAWGYDVSADGQRFLVNTPGEEATPSPISLVVNWPALLSR